MPVTKAEPGKTRIGWIGTGVMGRWMCHHLIAKGCKATVYNRTREKMQPLLDEGATSADSPKSVAERSDVVFAIVGFPKDVLVHTRAEVDRYKHLRASLPHQVLTKGRKLYG